jgi:tRNA pseudouridine55 synthase
MGRRGSRARLEAPGPSGFVVVDKPAGWTSHDVVDAARRWFGTRRIGHLGTLDPQATGVLPLALRDATKLISYVPADPKRYRGVVRLGVETETLDGDGPIVARHSGPLPDESAVRSVLAGFLGEHEQVPPMYSAVKQGGVPLYRLARRGEEVERAARRARCGSTRSDCSPIRGPSWRSR